MMASRVPPQPTADEPSPSGPEDPTNQVGLEVPDEKKNDMNTTVTVPEGFIDEGMDLESSAWEVIMLVRMETSDGKVLNWCQSIAAILAFILTVVFQAVFVIAVSSSMAVSPISDETLQGAMEQRLMTNHYWDNINLRELTTRAKDLCDGTIFNSLGFMYGDIDSYLNPDPAFDKVSIDGLVLVSIAVVIWSCSMTTELRRICELALAVLSLRTKHKGEHFAIQEPEGKIVCARASHIYKVFVAVIVLLPRLAIGVALLIYGCIFLANTAVISDIILNTCALEIVKSIDEYLFDALMSHRMRLIMENTRYVYRSADKDSLRGHITEAVPMTLRVALVSGIFAVTFAIPLTNFHDDIAAFNSRVCDYDLSFAWTSHPIHGLPVFTSVSAVDSDQPNDAEILRCWYQTQALMLETRVGYSEHHLSDADEISNSTLKSWVRGTHADCSSETVTGNSNSDCPNIGVAQMISISEYTTAEALDSPQYCVDFDSQLLVLQGVCMDDDYGKNVFTRKLEGTLRSSCADMALLCECDRTKREDQTCTEANYTTVIENQGITYAWIQKILKVCPQTCNQCSYETAGRRLSGEEEEEDKAAAEEIQVEITRPSASEGGMEQTPHPETLLDLPPSHPLVQKTRDLEQQLAAAQQRTAELEARFEARLAALEGLAK